MKFYKCDVCGKIVAIVKVKSVYEYCNLHGLWKA